MKIEKKVAIGVALLAMLMGTSASTGHSYRLPTNTIPNLYTIKMEPNIGDYDLTWSGEVGINVTVVEPTESMTLHSYKNLRIEESYTKLVDVNGTERSPIVHDRNDEYEFLSLHFTREIPIGKYVLRMRFSGYQSDEFEGLAKASHGIKDTPMVVGTDLQPIAARRVFPCWDEPSFKANFSISIEHSRDYTAISNMPEISSVEVENGKNLTVFGTTSIMSTYLVNFVIADYETIHNEYRNVSLSGSSNGLRRTKYVMDLNTEMVRFMESYTGSPFGFPRIGSVLIPRYRPAAMEQWGLVSYKEKTVSFDSTVNTTRQKDKADMTIAHEIAHTWFGNRVTPLWWNDLWISEGFATYFGYYIMNEIQEKWGGFDQFIVTNNHERAFDLDDVRPHPVQWQPLSNEDVLVLFEPITDYKGAAIIHMIRNVLGDDVFRTGVQILMVKHSFGSVNASDVANAFQEAYERIPGKKNRLELERIMSSWLTQRGYPVVSVRRNYTTGDTKLSQKSILAGHNREDNAKWWIPVNYATKSNPNFTSTLPVGWMTDKGESVRLHGIDKDDWIVMDIRASGYYMVDYDRENWNRLIKYLNSDDYKNIHVLNRAKLISDASYLRTAHKTRHGYVFYELTRYLSREVEYLPWRVALSAIVELEESIHDTADRRLFREHYVRLMERFIEKVGFEVRDDDDHFTKLSRTDLIEWACRAGHSGCSEYAAKELIGLMEFPAENRLHPDTKTLTFCAGLRGLNRTAAKQFTVWAYHNERHALETNAGCSENHEIHEILLNNSVNNINAGDPEEFIEVFSQLLRNSDDNFNFTVDFFIKNHETFINYTSTLIEERSLAGYLFEAVLNEVTNRVRLEKFHEILGLDVRVRAELEILDGVEETATWLVSENESLGKSMLSTWQPSSDFDQPEEPMEYR